MRQLIILILCLFIPTSWATSPSLFQQTQNQAFLPPEQAFQASLHEATAKEVVLEFKIAPGTYLYQKEFKFTAEQAKFGAPHFPEGKIHHDPYFGEVTVYEHSALITLPFTALYSNPFTLTASYQGCNETGFCYPPQTADIKISLPAHTPLNQTDKALHLLQEAPLGWALAAFYGFGLLLAFTPCVLPMVPILSALIIGEQHKHHRLHALRLALTYVLAMATTYSILGGVVASLGAQVQAQLQHPAMLSFTALILVLMAILLFNDKALAFAARANHPIDKLWRKLHRGKTLGVFLMGMLSALIISPCVTPPLIGALTYISMTGDVKLGASALFLLACGMGTPLILVTWGGTALLPNRGPWLNYIKHAFAVLLLIMAASLMIRFIAPTWDWRQLLSKPSHEQVSKLPFKYVHTVSELDQALAHAKKQGKPVMLDFYADWCTSCISLEHTVFSDPKIAEVLTQVVLLKADVTEYNGDTKAMMNQWKVYGPPALIFFDSHGNSMSQLRVDGLVSIHDFSERLNALLQKPH